VAAKLTLPLANGLLRSCQMNADGVKRPTFD
jgi:hypothetical protein